MGQANLFLVPVHELAEGLKKMVRSVVDQFEVEHRQNIRFKGQDVFFWEGSWRNGHEFGRFGHSVGLLVFGGDEESCGAYQLELVLGHWFFWEVAIQDGYDNEEGLGKHLEFEVDFN